VQEQRLALKRGDPPYNLTKDKFADIATAYLAQVTPMKKSAYNESIIIKRLLTEKWVTIALGELTAGHLCDYRDNRLKSLKPPTFKREWHLVRSIAKYGRAVGININLLVFEELKLPKVYERRIERITPAQEERLLEVARLAGNRVKYMTPFINLALATAMRRGELCSLEWHEVDLQNRRIHIRADKAKSGKPRTIPMTDRAVDALNELLSIRKYDRKTKGPNLFVIPATGNAVRLAFGRIRKFAGLEHIRIHDFRHEAISRFHEAGLTLPEIQSITGHGHIDMLQRYSHASVDNLVAKLGGVK
jgi:integrase